MKGVQSLETGEMESIRMVEQGMTTDWHQACAHDLSRLVVQGFLIGAIEIENCAESIEGW